MAGYTEKKLQILIGEASNQGRPDTVKYYMDELEKLRAEKKASE